MAEAIVRVELAKLFEKIRAKVKQLDELHDKTLSLLKEMSHVGDKELLRLKREMKKVRSAHYELYDAADELNECISGLQVSNPLPGYCVHVPTSTQLSVGDYVQMAATILECFEEDYNMKESIVRKLGPSMSDAELAASKALWTMRPHITSSSDLAGWKARYDAQFT
eukprot:Colp12_sorted_trinity150504_noHs@28944